MISNENYCEDMGEGKVQDLVHASRVVVYAAAVTFSIAHVTNVLL